MMSLEWTSQADADLDEILEYIGQRNPVAASKLLETISSAAERLTLIPLAFPVGRVHGTREYVVHPNYVLVYKVNSVSVQILRVMHGKRQYP